LHRACQAHSNPRQLGSAACLDTLVSRLLAVDVHPEVAAQLTGQAQRIAADNGEDTRHVLHRLVMERLDDAPLLKPVPGARRLALFAGPAGVGKTTTILKLAAELGSRPGTVVGLLSADYSRAGAHAQLVTLGRLLRVPVAVIQSAAEVPAALDQLRSCDLILIDTAGCNPLDAAQRNRLHELADCFQPDEVYLCLSASTTFSACRRMLEQFRFLDGYRLVVTKTDEAPESGTVLNISSLAGRPPAYLTSGQQVPGQIRTCDARLMADRMMG
jgi:flagellar biosynthesis protein FlhF